MKTKRFVVTGSIDVQGRRVLDSCGSIVGYKQKDRSTVRLVVALEVENEQGTKYKYLTTDKQMRTRGFTVFQYDQTEFTN